MLPILRNQPRKPANQESPRPAGIPTVEISDSRYLVKFAGNAAEIDAALKLRFEVFNLELGEGLETSFATFRDKDEFDEQCHHLIVMEKPGGGIIGTYRMQTREMAVLANGFYSAGEYDLSQFPPAVQDQSVEVGRACITKAHRNGRVLFLLWRGIAEYLRHTGKRYLFGCCSLTSQNAAEGVWLMNYLEKNGYRHRQFWVPARPGWECQADAASLAEIKPVAVPRLFRLYLDYGAKICSPPAIDRYFKTIDYLVILDIRRLNKRVYEMFFNA
jgi:putative hemolysin